MKLKPGLAFLFLLLAGHISYGQTTAAGYDRLWGTVDSLRLQKGLPVSALAEVKKIYAMAHKEKNEPQMIKALVYRIRLEQNYSDEGLPAAIREMQKNVDSSSQPAKSILQNMLASLYQRYLQDNSWTIRSRTSVAQKNDTDISTWALPDLINRTRELYLRSLDAEQQLTHIDIAHYAPIVVKGLSPEMRPTLYDLLAHRALDYFRAGEQYVSAPVNPFVLNDPALLSDAADFSQHHFITNDSLSGHYLAIRVFQRLIRLHLGDARPEALITVDIERITFVHDYGSTLSGDAFMQTLGRLTEKYSASPAAAQAWYMQANEYYTRATAGQEPLDTNGNIKAREICERVLAEHDSSEGKANCSRLLQSILHKQLALESEKVNIPNKPFRTLVSWQNFDRLYLRLVRLMDNNAADQMKGNVYDTAYLKHLLEAPAYRSWVQDLPATPDLRMHTTEIAVGSLPPGAYVFLASSDGDWSRKRGVLGLQYIIVSSIAYFNQGNDYFVVNRETGQPIAGAKVQLLDQTFTRPPHGVRVRNTISYTTDNEGHFVQQLDKKGANSVQLLEISIPGDHLWPMEGGYYPLLTEDTTTYTSKRVYEENQAHCFLFTDRSIYRPGQTLYFKGIITTKDFDTHQPKPLAGFVTKVLLYNPNNQTVDSLQLTTNEFGSYQGSMKLPENQLNGRYQLSDPIGSGYAEISVEEYKRPKFYVEYEKLHGSYRAGDSIRVTGMAKAYAGNAIDGARVSYHVVRRANFPYSWMFWRSRMPYSRNQEIASGTAMTDASGKFSFVFYAAPDQQIKSQLGPEYNFEVSTDVTDINGETRTGTTDIVAGYTGVKVSLELPGGERLPADSMRTVVVSARNLSGERVNERVDVGMYLLRGSGRLIRQRLWDAPDRFVLTEKEFLDSFPHDEYRTENEKETWARGEKVWAGVAGGTAAVGGDSALKIPGGILKPGWYVIEATAKDVSGQEVKDLHYVELYDGATGKPGDPQYSWVQNRKVTVEPGATATAMTGSSARDVYVVRSVVRDQTQYSHYTLDGERKETKWAITEKDRGGFGVEDAFVKDNRLYTNYTIVDVPWTNKELDIHYTSFRDKTEPGSAEKWSMTVSGRSGEKVSAEVLTALYDASLDQFKPHSWPAPSVYPTFSNIKPWNSWTNFLSAPCQRLNLDPQNTWFYNRPYSELLSPLDEPRIYIRGRATDQVTFKGNYSNALGFVPIAPAARVRGKADDAAMVDYAAADSVEYLIEGKALNAWSNGAGVAPEQDQVVQARKDFRETAFFFPELRTDSVGNVSFSFTMPDALTTWKWMTLASTRDLSFGYSAKSVITQKELMVQPNAPRFLREGDKMELQVKVVNLTDSELTGQMSLQLTDPTTGQTADGWFVNRQPNQYFTVSAHQSFVVAFPLDIPYQYSRPLTYKVVAQAGKYSDGEEATLPVVSNRMLVTESLPLNMPGDGTRHFEFNKLLQSGNSETLNHHSLTVEFTANPAWYAVQSLPYLAEYPYECAEQTFERFYANALAGMIAGSSPRLQQVFERWRTADTAQLLSNLQKNQELKTVLLEETPWVLQGKTEAEQKKNIALLFDMNRMSKALESALNRLLDMQSADGAFPWFNGGPDDRYITQYILTGIGHLKKLGAIPAALKPKVDSIVAAALPYLDEQIKKDYKFELAYEQKTRASGASRAGSSGGATWIGGLPIQYLYMRSLLTDRGIPGDVFPAINYYRKKAQHGWVQNNKYLQGMIALALFRTGDVQTAKDILASLRQNAIHDEERGMYWKGMEGGYFWYDAPVETQSLLIEAFREISGDAATDRELKTWLLRQKQTHSWPTTTATADACYALLLGGQDWLNAERTVELKLGDKTIDWPAASGASGALPDVGYNKQVFDGPFVNPSMGNVTVTMKTKGGGGSPAWGAVYWQYFDMLDRITPTGGVKPALSVVKRLYIQRNSDRGPVLDSVADNATLKAGDRVVVRMVVKADRDMEYVHLKDMRAACMEPVNVLSGYKWQDGLGYYETTKDVSTDFFFNYLARGTHVFEYTLLAGQSGNFSNGVTSIECMYAPEFSYHSEGIRVNVEAP